MKVLRLICIAALIVSVASFSYAEEVKRTGKIMSVMGDVEIKLSSEDTWTRAEEGKVISEGDMLKTGNDSWVILNLNGSGETATVEVEPNSELMLAELIADKEMETENTLLDLAAGEIIIKAQKLHTPESRFEVKTPTSIVGVRGTKFSVKVEAVE